MYTREWSHGAETICVAHFTGFPRTQPTVGSREDCGWKSPSVPSGAASWAWVPVPARAAGSPPSPQAVKEILDTWEAMKFSVVKYYKGTQERGYILGSVDDIVQCLDDNVVNLQSISGSRFVGPFLQTVHKWEKTLSLIGEVIEVGRAGLLGRLSESLLPVLLGPDLDRELPGNMALGLLAPPALEGLRGPQWVSGLQGPLLTRTVFLACTGTESLLLSLLLLLLRLQAGY